MVPLRRLAASALAVAFVSPTAGAAWASQLIDRGASSVRLGVSADGYAVLSYRVAGETRVVHAWGARNALAPSPSRSQVGFRLRYLDGDRPRVRGRAPASAAQCRPYSGPPLHWLVDACTAPDGSYWAVQSWTRGLPDYGLRPTAQQAARELRLSHWSGPVATLFVGVDWAYDGRFDHLYGSLTYLGLPVYGFQATKFGAPLDGFGRSVYVDTLGSAYGAAWHRENSFLTNRPTGFFCYGFYPHGRRPSGKGTLYRATAVGPGVTPDLFWQGRAPGPYDAATDAERNAQQAELGAGPTCHA
jgi:hypothetical protein